MSLLATKEEEVRQCQILYEEAMTRKQVCVLIFSIENVNSCYLNLRKSIRLFEKNFFCVNERLFSHNYRVLYQII